MVGSPRGDGLGSGFLVRARGFGLVGVFLLARLFSASGAAAQDPCAPPAGDTGFAVSLPGDLPPHVTLFAESASRAVVGVAPERASRFEDMASALRVPFARLGETGGPRMVFDNLFELTVAEARAIHEDAIPRLLDER